MDNKTLLKRIVTNADKYTITDNGLEYRLEEEGSLFSIFYARHDEFKHILNCIYTLKTLLGKEINSDYIDNVASFFSMLCSVYAYTSNYRLEELMNNKYLKSTRYDLTDLEKQIIITYFISIPKEVQFADTDSEGCSYNSVVYSKV